MSRQCKSCHEPISPKRLAALPNAVLCIDCQKNQGQSVCMIPATNMARLGYTRMVRNDPYATHRPRRMHLSTYGLGAA